VELEQRVKALEYEMKILKNEVQRTLLDIQEQVLIHYYPALRSEEISPSEGLVQEVKALRARQSSAGETSAPPAAKPVTLDEVRTGHAEATGSTPVPSATASAGLDQAVMVKLSKWVSESAAKIGKERTGKLIMVYGKRGILPSQAKDALLRVASLSKGVAPENVAVNEVLSGLLKLDELLGRVAKAEEALSLIKEANIG
jgi:hypothetical protein